MRFLLLLLLALLAPHHAAAKITDALPARSDVIAGYGDTDSVAARMASLGPHPAEGIWEFPAEGTEIAIERSQAQGAAPSAAQYRIIVVRSADRSIRPGTVMGIMTPATGNTFDAALYTSHDGSRLTRPARFTLTLSENGSELSLRAVKKRWSIELHRLLPYLFRRMIRTNRGSDGSATPVCVKIFPQPDIPMTPRYL